MSAKYPGDHEGRETSPTDMDRALMDLFRREMDSLRADVKGMVEQEVRRVAVPESKVEKTVAEIARKTLEDLGAPHSVTNRVKVPGEPRASTFTERLLRPETLRRVGGFALVVAIFWVGRIYERWYPATVVSGAPRDSIVVADSGDLPSAEEEPVALWKQRVERYDSLFAARDPVFDVLLSPDGLGGDLQAAVAAWQEKRATPQQEERVHVLMLQRVLSASPNRPLDVDGLMGRWEACNTGTCKALELAWKNARTPVSLPDTMGPVTADVRWAAAKALILEYAEERRSLPGLELHP